MTELGVTLPNLDSLCLLSLRMLLLGLEARGAKILLVDVSEARRTPSPCRQPPARLQRRPLCKKCLLRARGRLQHRRPQCQQLSQGCQVGIRMCLCEIRRARLSRRCLCEWHDEWLHDDDGAGAGESLRLLLDSRYSILECKV